MLLDQPPALTHSLPPSLSCVMKKIADEVVFGIHSRKTILDQFDPLSISFSCINRMPGHIFSPLNHQLIALTHSLPPSLSTN
jgi:hypothetical protein